MKKILFTDLDDTLFQSFRKKSPDLQSVPVAYLPDGSAFSYASTHQQATLTMFQREMTIIPVTARNFDSFKRVRISFEAEAVLNYGGVIINNDGFPDKDWLNKSEDRAQQSESDLILWLDAINAESNRLGLDLNVRFITDFNVPFYVVAKSKSNHVGAVLAAADFCMAKRACADLPEVIIHVNNNNLAILPVWLDKRNAVNRLCKRYLDAHNNILTFGMGDSLVDVNFMTACDYIIVPASSQIANLRLGVCSEFSRKL